MDFFPNTDFKQSSNMTLQKSQCNDKLSRKVMSSSFIQNKKHSSKQVVPITQTLEKRVLAAATFKGLWVVFFGQSKKTSDILWSVRISFAFLEVRRQNKYCL